MKITIIIPAYNSEKYIIQCLNSIVEYINEIIVINDGSTDGTHEILQEYSKNHDNIKLFDIENHGVSYARNFGIKMATNDFIMFVDSDDIVKPNLKRILNNLKDNSQDIIYISKSIEEKSNKEDLLRNIIGLKKPCIAGPYCKIFNKIFLTNNDICFATDIVNGEDMLFNVESILKCSKFEIINENIYLYRQIISASTKRFNLKIVDSDRQFYNKLNFLLEKEKVEDSIKKSILDYCSINSIVTLLDRMSYLNGYIEFQKHISFLNLKHYRECLHINMHEVGISTKTVLFLTKIKRYRILYFLFKMKHQKLRNAEYFVEI